MKKKLFVFFILIISFILTGCNYKKINIQPLANKTISSSTETGSNPTSFKNATYILEGTEVTLKEGLAESAISTDSSSKVITRYFGNEAFGDLNADGKNDIAFLMTQENGGSGTFYYVAVGLMFDNGYRGLNAILLGDRISPQTTEIRDGEIVVNYADRNVGEPFSVKPSLGVSKYFKVLNNKLIEVK